MPHQSWTTRRSGFILSSVVLLGACAAPQPLEKARPQLAEPAPPVPLVETARATESTTPTSRTENPEDSVHGFFWCIERGLTNQAAGYVAAFDDTPADRVARLLDRAAELMSKGAYEVEVRASHVAEDVAVVVLIERIAGSSREADTDPMYLLRHNGHWRILLKLPEYEWRPNLTARQKQSYDHARAWYKQQLRQAR